MKKISFFAMIFMVLSFLLTININEIRAEDCPGGDNQKIEDIWVNGCWYEVTICYQCAGTAPYGYINVSSFRKMDPNCPQTWNTFQVLQGIYSQVYTGDFIKTKICLNENVAPCEPYDGGIFYHYNFEICWQKKLLADGTVFYYPCSSGNTYCFAMFKICWDATIPGYRTTQLSPYDISGDYEGRCKGVLEPAHPTEIGVPTACFEVQTPCTP